MIDLYAAAKWGPTALASYNGSAGAAVRFRLGLPTNRDKALFAIRATTACRVLQGGSTVAATATTAAYLAAGAYYPVLVEGVEDQYLSMISDTTSAGTLEVTLVSDTVSWVLGPCGTGDSLAITGSTVTITDAAGKFQSADVGKYIWIQGASSSGNNGKFLITAYTSATSIDFTNASGANETSSFTYQVTE